jgi:hypothetical protein
MVTSNEKKAGTPEELTPQERRRTLRFPFTASIEVIETKSGARITGRTSDLGLGGCYVDVMTPFPIGSEAQARIIRGTESFEANVKVVFSQVGMGMGLAFVSAQPSQYRLFQRWIQEISGKVAPLPESNEPEKRKYSVESSQPENGDKDSHVLHELLVALMRKKVLTEEEGMALLKKLPR